MPPLTSLPARSPEFAEGADVWPPDLDRRGFLGLMGASLALGGLAGCRAAKTLVPYTHQPDSVVPGLPSFYASACPCEGFARGILVEAHEGRPTKIEGNPRHAESGGAADAVTQAAILALYDPDRSQAPLHQGRPASWPEFESAWREEDRRLAPVGGAGLALLTEPTTSPTVRAGLHRLLDRFPRARWFQHTALARYDAEGFQPDYDLAEADVILAIEGGFLDRHPAALRYTRAFAGRRRVEKGAVRANRLYALESAWSLAGAMADRRLAAPPARLPAILNAVATAWSREPLPETLDREERAFVTALTADLRRPGRKVLCIAGDEQPAAIRRWAQRLNQVLGAVGKTIRYRAAVRSDGDPRSAGDLGALADAIARGEISALAILGANPVYTGPADVEFAARLARVPFTLHLGGYADETAAAVRWHLPESHFLEAWSDLRGYDGSAVIQQPLIDPLYDTRSLGEVLRLLAGDPPLSGYDLVRATWRARLGADDFDGHWTRWLNAGVVDGENTPTANPEPAEAEEPVPYLDPEPAAALTLVLRPDPWLGDGRHANNGWLQELPRPFTALVWDNALLISPQLGREQRLENGDLVRVECEGRVVEAPVWLVPGQAEGCAVAHWGGGRTRAGAVGSGRGFDAFRLQSRSGRARGLKLTATGRKTRLASTQHQFAMDGRDPVQTFALRDLGRLRPEQPAISLYPARARDTYAWGMSIDLSTCIGCSACVAACQAENNIPVVGKEQVLRGRVMHWIRVDTYFAGEPGAERCHSQPVPCMQCENAPCELVCPVGATVHSSEGLNEMVYNRCVGTRYCSNNCPYKVRRFNFFDFRAAADSILHLQDNPEVTVRQRGVMEKCTYCVQRINRARSEAERDNRPIRDGEIRTACQQACPAEAIVFGNVADPASAVAQRKAEPSSYSLLAELNTRPRTTYLAKMINPA